MPTLSNSMAPETQDQLARNCVAGGKYVIISFHRNLNDPIVVSRGMTERLWNIAMNIVRSVRKGGDQNEV